MGAVEEYADGQVAVTCAASPLKSAGTTQNGTTAQPVDFAAGDYFSQEAVARPLSSIREIVISFHGIPDTVPMHGGLPPQEVFPMDSLQLGLKEGDKIDITDPLQLLAAQQYNQSFDGHPPLHNWIVNHMQEVHRPPFAHRSIITSGSNAAVEIVMRTFLNPGDAVLCEEYTYSVIPETLVAPAGWQSVGVPMDAQGIIPAQLLKVLEALKAEKKPIPRLLYTIPVGQNPTGATSPLERKRAIYKICQAFDILIMEDDPYFYLQFSSEGAKGLEGLGQSYLSLDTDGRVIRLDTFSKILAPGLRLGWITAAPPVIEKVISHLHGIAMGACSMSQVVVGEILERWGPSGFERHIKDVQAKYARRAAIVHQAARNHLSDLADWAAPDAGMFIWMKLRGIRDAREIFPQLKEARVVVIPGFSFWHGGPAAPVVSPFLRVSFVACAEADLEVGIARLACVLKEFHHKQSAYTEAVADQPAKTTLLQAEEVI